MIVIISNNNNEYTGWNTHVKVNHTCPLNYNKKKTFKNNTGDKGGPETFVS